MHPNKFHVCLNEGICTIYHCDSSKGYTKTTLNILCINIKYGTPAQHSTSMTKEQLKGFLYTFSECIRLTLTMLMENFNLFDKQFNLKFMPDIVILNNY